MASDADPVRWQATSSFRRFGVSSWATLGLIGCLVLAGCAQIRMETASAVWPAVEYLMYSEEFVGITADGDAETNLFELEATGVDTQPIADAASRFVASLDGEQRERLLHPIDSPEWQHWANIHLAPREGVSYQDMTPVQTEAANALLRVSLSARGYATAQDIMRLEGHLALLLDNHVEYGEKRYWFTLMGEPSTEQPWGWQIDGHHLVINFFVLGDQVVMTPTFMGSEPTRADSGKYAGTEILVEETAAGLELMGSLTPEQREKAVLDSTKDGNHNRSELFQDNAVIPYEGLELSELSADQAEVARKLIGLYVGRIRDDHAAVEMANLLEHWDRTRFAWVGGTSAESVFYYRIHSPVVLIEFDHQSPIALSGPGVPSRDHVHTVVRTPNGNDYGKDLLRQHLEQHPH